MNKPQTRKEVVADTINGITIQDPYRWLEDANSPEVKEWIKQENEYLDLVASQ